MSRIVAVSLAVLALSTASTVSTVQAQRTHHRAGAITPASRTVASACRRQGPSVVEIGREMSRTVEVRHRAVHFTPISNPLTTGDGRGTGTITAIAAVRWPEIGRRGTIVFLWHNATFLGWDTPFEKGAVKITSPAAGLFVITYDGRKTVSYAWSSNGIFIANGVPPQSAVKVTLSP